MEKDKLFEALADDVMADVLRYTTEEPRSANELADLVNASPSTVYRRLDTLVEHDIVSEGLQLDRDGNHHHVYRTTIERLEVELAEEQIRTQVERREDAVDRFVRIWEDIRGE